MDLTPRLLTEVEFREQWRGYSQNDVDDFLKRVAAAVGELQERLQEATERASSAERRLLERSDDDEIRRTLVLAQRTAVTAVEEARAEAERTIDDADRRAQAMIAEAEARVAIADQEIAERTRVELGELADRRAALQADIDALVAFQEEHRARLRAELERQLAELEAPAAADQALAVPEPPEVTEVDTSVPELDIELEPVPVPEAAPEPEPAPEAYVPRAPTEEEVAQAREDLIEALRRAGVEELLEVPEAESAPWVAPAYAADPEPEAPRLYDAADESGEIDLAAPAGEATGIYDALADDDADEGEAVQWRAPDLEPEPEVAAPQVADDDDPFLAELRRAVTDTEPLGPRDEGDDVHHLGTDHDAVPSARFRLRRGR